MSYFAPHLLPEHHGQGKQTAGRMRTDGQTELRGPIACEMVDEILECPIDTFLDHYAPFIPSDRSVTVAFNELRAASLLKMVGNNWAFADYTEPIDRSEPLVFKSLENIMNVLQSEKVEAKVERKRLFSYKDCSSSTMASEIDGTNFKVDPCVTSDLGADKVVLSDVVTFAEFKKADGSANVEDNRLKLVAAAAQIMNDDPRRMWVYGITIEGTKIAVWYFCRSHSVISRSFDFARDVNTFTRVFLSLLYADEQEIGYDPTVHLVMHEKQNCYVYEIGTDAPRYYRTTELIFAARVLCITGRKTRVWKAVEVNGYRKGQFEVAKSSGHVVLKDGWLDEGSRSEQENQQAIFERLRNVKEADYYWASDYLRGLIKDTLEDEKYKDYFMEITDSCQLGKTRDRHVLAEPNRNILSFAEQRSIGALHSFSSTMQSGNHSGTPADIPSRTAGKKGSLKSCPREYKTKQQHRLVYRHVGCPLSDAKDLSTSFYAIHDTFIALVLLYLARWTHRDVSAGNIIIVETDDGGVQGKLSDLEYAKEFNDETSSADPKTGTAHFMPVEIHRSRPVYNPPGLKRPMKVNKGKAPHTSQVSIPPTQVQPPRPMKYRFQHDLESLWWVTVWILLYRVGGHAAQLLVRRIFIYSDTPSEDRVTFFMIESDQFEKSIDVRLKFLATSIHHMREVLTDSYKDEQRSEDMLNPQRYTDIYDDMWDGILGLFESAERVEGIGFRHPAPEPDPVEEDSHTEQNTHIEKDTKKRPRSNSQPMDGDEYTPSRHHSTRAKATLTGSRPTRKKRAAQLPRRNMGQ